MPDPKPLTGMPDDALLTPNEMMAEAGRRARRRAEAVADDKADIEATVNTGPVQAVTVQAASIAGKGVAARPRAARRLAASEPTIADHIDYEAEDNTLAACIQGPTALAAIAKMVSDGALSIGDFHRPSRGRLLGVMCDLYAAGTVALDPAVVRTAVEKDVGLLSDLGGRDAVFKLTHYLYELDVIDANVHVYAETVREEAAQRQYVLVANKIAKANGKPVSELVGDAQALLAAVPAQAAPRDDLLVSFNDIEAKPVRWLWERWIPAGMASILFGLSGLGKSHIQTDITARISRGTPFPDGSPAPQGNVVIMSAEDPAETVLKPRLVYAEADCSRVLHFPSVAALRREGQARLLAPRGPRDTPEEHHPPRRDASRSLTPSRPT